VQLHCVSRSSRIHQLNDEHNIAYESAQLK
jgi:hypothetical protein